MLPFELICQIVAPSFFVFTVAGVFFINRKRKKKKPPTREIKFTLPDRENTFVRARLATALNGELATRAEQKARLAVDFTQALQMLEKIKASPLTSAEQIEVAGLCTDLRSFAQKDLFTTRETAAINESFLRILKLSAKYKI